jgi:hypothetical protein
VGKRKPDLPPPGVVDELFTRIEELEARTRALEDAARAFAVASAIPRIPDKTGDGDTHESTSRGE